MPPLFRKFYTPYNVKEVTNMITILGVWLLKRYIYDEKQWDEFRKDEHAQLLAGAIFVTEMTTIGFIEIIRTIFRWIKGS